MKRMPIRMIKDGFSAYDSGFGFANAFRLLYSKSILSNLIATKDYIENYNNISMIMPTIVNGALACELFLKALIQQECKSHSLLDLMEQLEKEQPGKKAHIQDSCIKIMHEKKQRNTYDKQNFLQDMELLNKAFVKLRYWHEPRKDNEAQKNEIYSLDFVEIMVAILQTECQIVFGPRPQSLPCAKEGG